MKKVIKWISLLLILVVIPCLLPDCSCAYSGDSLSVENLQLEPNSFARRCFASTVSWPEGQTEMVLRIPDKVEGKRVTALGGFVGSGGPSPFWVNIPGSGMEYPEELLPEDAVVEQYHMTIILGKYVREIKLADLDSFYHMGDNRYIQILITIDLGENTYFGLQEGKLYCKATGEVEEGFFFASEYGVE